MRYYLDAIPPAEREILNKLFSRALFSSNIALSAISDNTHWINFFKRIRPYFQVPSRKLLGGPLLDEEYTEVKKMCDEKIDDSNYLSIQIDGWSNIRNEAILNFIICTPSPVFYKTLATRSVSHTGKYIFEQIDLILQEVGTRKFQSVVTDNVSNCRAAGALIEQKYDYISYYTCADHAFNLYLQDIFKCEPFKGFQTDCKDIVKQVNHSHLLRASFVAKQKELNPTQVPLSLLMPVATRWTSMKGCICSLMKTKFALKALVVQETTERLFLKSSRDLILNDVFWSKLEKLYSIIKPVYDWILVLQSDAIPLSLVVEAFYYIKMAIPQEPVNTYYTKKVISYMKKSLAARKKMACKNIHSAANILDARFRGKHLEENEDIEGMEFIHKKIRETYQEEEEVQSALSQLAHYRCRTDFFGKPFVLDSSVKTDPITWWKGTCFSSKLSIVAQKILVNPPTSAATERSFSSYGQVHSARQNRLNVEKAGKLTYIKHNLKLLSEEKSDILKLKSKKKVTSFLEKLVAAETEVDAIENISISDDDVFEFHDVGVGSSDCDEFEVEPDLGDDEDDDEQIDITLDLDVSLSD